MNLFIIFILLLFPVASFSQLKIVEEKHIEAENFYIDKLSNFYFIKNGKIVKKNNNFKKIAEYNNNFLGDITYADVSNPFRILLYYKDFNQIVFLDSYLAELKSPISLDELGAFDTGAVCYSLSGGFWIFRTQISQAIQYSQNLRKIQKGTELGSLTKNSAPVKMVETTKNIFILFENNKLFILDSFGSYYKNIKLDNIIDFKVINNLIYFYDGNFLNIINVNTLKEKKMPVFYDNIKTFDIFGQYIFCLTDKSLITLIIE